MNTSLKRILISFVLLVVGIVAINLIGESFISETTQEVTLLGEERSKVVDVELNEPAPSFELTDLEGVEKSLSDYLGSPLIITFWTSWNAHATDQIKILDDYITKEPDDEFQIITINNQEDKSVVSSFIRRGGYSIPVLIDDNGSVGELYKARSLPLTYFLDEKGVIKYIFIGILDEKSLIDKTVQLFSR